MTTAASPLKLPWGIKDLRRVAVANTLGVAGVLTAQIGADAADGLARQMLWLLISIGVLGGMGAANCSWFLVGRRAVGLRRRTLLRPLAQALRDPVGDDLLVGSGVLVFVTSMGRYHRSGCQLVAGKPLRGATREEHETSGRTPCGVCRP